MALVLHQDRHDLQIVIENDLLNLFVRRGGEAQLNVSQVRLKLIRRRALGRLRRGSHFDTVAKALGKGLQPRPPDIAKVIQRLFKLCQPILAIAIRIDLLRLVLLNPLFDGGKFFVDAAEQFFNFGHGSPFPSVMKSYSGRK